MIKIGKNLINQKNVFIISEIGNNHNGSFERAKKMVQLSKEMGANCAKFQMRNMSQVYRSKSLKKSGDDLSTEYTLDLLERFELSLDEQKRLSEFCNEIGILYMCTPWDEKSVDLLEEIGVSAYKVASADLTNIVLIDKLIKTRKPLILSTGMSKEDEIKKTIDHLNKNKAQFVILHCNSTYPAPFHNINLNYIKKLQELHTHVGYSGHERGIAVSLGAVALGACVIERHFTLDRNMEGPDHAASLEYNDFKNLIDGIRELELAMGEGEKKILSQGELMNRENLGKSLIASRKLKKGEVLKASDILVRSPGQGLSPQYLNQLIGTSLKRDMEEEDYFFMTDLSENKASARKFKFRRPWGVPVRYHDFQTYFELCQPDLFEFHLSYSDMKLKPEDFLKNQYSCDFVMHAPELFEGSLLMDLATPDENYRKKSVLETQKVIDITRELKQFFPKTKKPLIVANIGGFTMDEPLKNADKKIYYECFKKSLDELDQEGVELIPQTMAPYPWLFGGQRYQNLFLKADEIVEYCKLFDIRVCLDISHSKLACNHFNLSFEDFCEKVIPYTAHFHLVDAQGVDGEGLQIDEGEIDFKKLAALADKLNPKASFIPEIWQGHKNNGEGCWIALDRLEKYF